MTLRRTSVLLSSAVLACVLAACSSSHTSGHPTGSAADVTHTALAVVQADLRDALAATTWPDLSPSFTAPDEKDNHGCAVDAVPPISKCTWGNVSAPHTLYLVGDSTSGAYLPAFAAFIDELPTWKMVVRSDSGCPFSTTPAPEGNGLDPDAGSAACAAHNQKVVAEIKAGRPDMVVWTSVSGGDARIPGKQAELAAIEPYVGKIVVLPTSPPLKDPKQCDAPGSTPAACVTPIPKPYNVWLTNFKGIATAVHGIFIDPTELYCYNGQCPVFVKTIPKTDDGVHMTYRYAQLLAPAILELFHNEDLLT